MKRFLFFFVLCICSLTSFAQETVESKENASSTEKPDILPQYPSGFEGLMLFLSHNLNYPKKALDENVEGTVYVQFVVAKDGWIKDAKVVRSVSPEIDEEAMRVVSYMAKWKPAIKDGKPVQCMYTLPLKFKIPEKE